MPAVPPPRKEHLSTTLSAPKDAPKPSVQGDPGPGAEATSNEKGAANVKPRAEGTAATSTEPADGVDHGHGGP